VSGIDDVAALHADIEASRVELTTLTIHLQNAAVSAQDQPGGATGVGESIER
jgi:hypothetical protein